MSTKVKVPIRLTVTAEGEKTWDYAEIEVEKIAELLSVAIPI